MTGTDARELLTAARTAQAEAGPGTLADYPVPGGDAHLLIHYAPGSRAYRFKLTGPGENEVPPGANPEPGAPGHQAGPDGPPGGRETPDGSPAGDASSAPARGRPAPPGPAKITVTLWHNVAFDGQGRHVAMLDGYQPGDPVVRVFAYHADPGRPAEEITEEAFDTFNDHPQDPEGEELARVYYRHSLLRSLSFPETPHVATGRVAWTSAFVLSAIAPRCVLVLPLSVRKMPPPELILTVRRRSRPSRGLERAGEGRRINARRYYYPAPEIFAIYLASESRISSAVLVHLNGRGLSFQVSIQSRMSASRAWTLLWTPRRIFWAVR
jgi:hypothetical protein